MTRFMRAMENMLKDRPLTEESEGSLLQEDDQESDYGEDTISPLACHLNTYPEQLRPPLAQSTSHNFSSSSTSPSSGTKPVKRKTCDPSGLSHNGPDVRPTKKQRNSYQGPSTVISEQPYIIAHSPTVENFPGLPYGVFFEMARLISSNKLPCESISIQHLELLKGRNVESAPKTARTLFPQLASSSAQDPAFAQEMAAQSPWEELDKEEDTLAINPYAGLGNSHSFPGWYGGKVVFSGKLYRDGGSDRIVLNRTYLGPSCRFMRRFGSKNFLRIKIPKTIFHAPHNKLLEFFRRPFVLWGSVFRSFYAKDKNVFLFRTNEVMEDGYIYSDPSLPGMSLLQFIDWHNPLATNATQSMTKWAARTALGLSSSVPGPVIEPENILEEEDIISTTGSDMTDGCGSANRATHLQIMHMLNPTSYPTAIQFRLGGNKGLLTERADTSSREEPKVGIRSSQTKIRYALNHHNPSDLTLRTIEILRTSEMKTPARISPETIIMLAENGVPHSAFLNLVKTSIEEIVEGLTNWEGPDAMYKLWVNVEKAGSVIVSRRGREAVGEARVRGYGDRSSYENDADEDEEGKKADNGVEDRSPAWWADQTSGCPSSLPETVMALLDVGFDHLNSPILLEKLKQFTTSKIKTWTESYRYDVECSASAFVVPDPSGVLGVDEVQIKSSRRNLKDPGGKLTDMIIGDVLMTRNPCKLPTDIRKLRAVENPLLRDYTDVIVCSVAGLRRLLDFLAGGDYDGDRCVAIWDLAFVLSFTNADEKFSVAPFGVAACFTSDGNERVYEFLERTTPQLDSEKTLATQLYLLGALRDTSVVGVYSALHDNALYTLGPRHPCTIRLAYIFNWCLDGAKTGLRIRPETLKKDKNEFYHGRRPRWKPEDPNSNSTCLESKDTPFNKGTFIMDALRTAVEKERTRILIRMDTVFQPLPPRPDQHLTQPWEDAKRRAEGGSNHDIVQAKRRDLSKIAVHVQRMFFEHKLELSKDFTGLQITLRQDVLRSLSKKFSSAPQPSEMECLTDEALISRLRASYAYIYDMERHEQYPNSFSRFPWNLAFRELCSIKASALGPYKAVTNGFYERFKLSRR
ncbi:RNA-dependent RNA polymerase 1 [Hypsizygus marmoreus]|uniref:RNA-dependent RNA polymerase n=1 Tax=Hypsizygus marmoreus TaxID=39966 RepID=A0A369K021_HYPMA|nr:RNA-dependent RNA polymerase 1 [Hypsizygus marmoreus]